MRTPLMIAGLVLGFVGLHDVSVSAQNLAVDCTQKGAAAPSCPTPTRPCRPTCGHDGACRCVPPCPPPCPERPRGAQEQPRAAAQAVTGNYVAPPPMGAIAGPRRDLELGGISITFPEITLGLPRLRLHGHNRFYREGYMQLDSARAAYVENPYAAYQAAVMQQMETRQAQETPRRAAEEEEAKKECDDKSRGGEDLHQRLDQLEQCLQQQMDAMQRCMQQLRQIEHQSQRQNIPPMVRELPQPVVPPDDYSHGGPTRQVTFPEIGTATYIQPISPHFESPVGLRRLPAVNE